jgi:hypothetical protein
MGVGAWWVVGNELINGWMVREGVRPLMLYLLIKGCV